MSATNRLSLLGEETLAFRNLADGFIARVLRRIVLRSRMSKSKGQAGRGFVVVCRVEVRSKHHELVSSVVFDARRPVVMPVAPKRNSIGFIAKP